MQHTNQYGQPIGFPVEDWTPCELPPRTTIHGQYCRVEPFDTNTHGVQLHEAFIQDDSNWSYLFAEPFKRYDEFRDWMENTCCGDDPLFYTFIDNKTDKAVGMASYLRIKPEMGVIEVGHINFSPLMQKSPIATEAMYLMMKRVFDELEYRRYEWKCDALNEPSRKAAKRFGFTFEGIFRQAIIYKNRNRDTAWFSVIDSEWPDIKSRYNTWLAPENFDNSGHQIKSLKDC